MAHNGAFISLHPGFWKGGSICSSVGWEERPVGPRTRRPPGTERRETRCLPWVSLKGNVREQGYSEGACSGVTDELTTVDSYCKNSGLARVNAIGQMSKQNLERALSTALSL